MAARVAEKEHDMVGLDSAETVLAPAYVCDFKVRDLASVRIETAFLKLETISPLLLRRCESALHKSLDERQIEVLTAKRGVGIIEVFVHQRGERFIICPAGGGVAKAALRDIGKELGYIFLSRRHGLEVHDAAIG